MKQDKKNSDPLRLRSGFSTGAYAAATTVAAWRCLQGKPPRPELPLLFPDGRLRTLEIGGADLNPDGGAQAWAYKDAGDDIDITDRAVIRSRVSRFDGLAATPKDFENQCGKATLVLRGGCGVGVVRRPGLDVPAGKWAINPGPRRMMSDNLHREGIGDQAARWLIEIAIDQGAELARHTLNPVLGIEGGLSILGTSGLVIPCSHAAYLQTIRVMVQSAANSGARRIALVTGSRTQGWLQRIYPELPEYAVIRIGDFIREALECCQGYGIKQIIVGCMAGKLAKYALGHGNTHAHRVGQEMDEVLRLLKMQGFSAGEVVEENPFSCRAFLEGLPALQQRRAVALLAETAATVFQDWAPKSAVEILVFDPEGELISRQETS